MMAKVTTLRTSRIGIADRILMIRKRNMPGYHWFVERLDKGAGSLVQVHAVSLTG
jgi:hypothetical protein